MKILAFSLLALALLCEAIGGVFEMYEEISFEDVRRMRDILKSQYREDVVYIFICGICKKTILTSEIFPAGWGMKKRKLACEECLSLGAEI